MTSAAWWSSPTWHRARLQLRRFGVPVVAALLLLGSAHWYQWRRVLWTEAPRGLRIEYGYRIASIMPYGDPSCLHYLALGRGPLRPRWVIAKRWEHGALGEPVFYASSDGREVWLTDGFGMLLCSVDLGSREVSGALGYPLPRMGLVAPEYSAVPLDLPVSVEQGELVPLPAHRCFWYE